MSRKTSPSTFLIEEEDPGVCEMCGKTEELRPYGPNGENICFDCGMKDPEAADEQFIKRLLGPPETCH